jgi:hypothetical protein
LSFVLGTGAGRSSNIRTALQTEFTIFWVGLRRLLPMTGSLSYAVAALRQLNSFRFIGGFGVECVSKCDRQHLSIGSVHDLEAPASPVLALLIPFSHHLAGFGERRISRSVEAGVRVPFRVFDDTALGSDVEVVKSRM